MQTRTHTQWLAAAESQKGSWGRSVERSGRRGGQADSGGESKRKMSQFADCSVGSARGRIPLLELLAVSLGLFPTPSIHTCIYPSKHLDKEIFGAGSRPSGARCRSNWVIIRPASCPPVCPNPQPPTLLVAQNRDRNCSG